MRRARRSGFTILELLVVLSILIILGAILAPTLKGLSRDTNVKAAADTLRGRIADARAHAVGDGRVYVLAVSPDGTRVRVSADLDAIQEQADGSAPPPFQVTADFPKEVAVEVLRAADAAVAADAGGWQTVATFLPDGTCKENTVEIRISEPDTYTMAVTIRGLTGAVSVAPVPPGQQGRQGQVRK